MNTAPRKLVVNGFLRSVELRPQAREIGSRLPYRTGKATIVAKRSSVNVWGRLPVIPTALRMSFAYYANATGNNLVDTETPRLDKRSVRLTAHGMGEARGIDLAPALRVREKTAFVNIYCAVDFEAALKRAGAFDAANGTACMALVALLRLLVDEVLKDDAGPQSLMRVRALLVAQMVPLFGAVFEIGFFDLMLVPFADLLRLFVALHRDGPLVAFKRHVFEIDAKGYCGNGRELTPAELEGIREAAAAARDKDDPDPPAERRRIVLQLRFQRARDLYYAQKVQNRVDVRVGEDADEPAATDADEDEDDDDNGGEGSSVGLFGVGMKRPAPANPARAPFELTMSDAADAPVIASSNGRLTVGVPLDMRRLTPEQWVMLMITDILTDNYHKNNHFGFTCAKMVELLEYVKTLADFPVDPVTAQMMHATALGMVRNDELRVVDLRSGSFLCAAEIEHAYKDGLFADPAAPLLFGLPWIVDKEEELASDLAAFLEGKREAAAARAKSLLAGGHGWVAPAGVTFAPEQRRALAYAATLPLVLVNGAGGTGKSLVMRLDYERMRRESPGMVVLCLAFKNDTVNQMRAALVPPPSKKPRDPKEPEPRIYFRTADSFILAGGAVYVANKATGALEYAPVECMIIDEAAMLSTQHMAGILRAAKRNPVTQIKMYGDGDQLPPISAGIPFCNLMTMLAPFCVTLCRNFRTSAPKLMRYVMSVRARDVTSDSIESFFDDPAALSSSDDDEETTAPPVTGSSYWVSDVNGYYDTQLSFGPSILEVVKRIDPGKTRYADMMCVTPYREMAHFVSAMLDLHYFGGSAAPVTDAIAQIKAREPPVLHRGMYVVIAETDRANKEIARGRVGQITHIIDHEPGRTVDPDAELPPGMLEPPSTRVGIPRNWERSIVLDGRTVVKFRYDRAVTTLLHQSACRTIHRAQGDQKKIVLCVFPPGRMSNARIWYTAISRAQELCVTFATAETLGKMATTEPEPCMSAQEAFLRAELSGVADLDAMAAAAADAAVRADAANVEMAGMAGLDAELAADMALFDEATGSKTESE